MRHSGISRAAGAYGATQHAIAPGLLRGVEGLVGGLDPRMPLDALAIRGDARAEGDAEVLVLAGGVVERREFVRQARDQALRVVDRQVIEEHAELLAAVASDDVGAPQVLPQRGGQRRQDAVARLVPVRVVDAA